MPSLEKLRYTHRRSRVNGSPQAVVNCAFFVQSEHFFILVFHHRPSCIQSLTCSLQMSLTRILIMTTQFFFVGFNSDVMCLMETPISIIQLLTMKTVDYVVSTPLLKKSKQYKRMTICIVKSSLSCFLKLEEKLAFLEKSKCS